MGENMSKNIYGRFIVNPNHIKKLKSIADYIKVNLDPSLEFEENSHCTVIYIQDQSKIDQEQKDAFLNLYSNEPCNYSSTVLHFSKLGKALVLEIDFPEGTKRYNSYVENGYLHSFPRYRAHVTIFNDFPHDINKIPEQLKTFVKDSFKQINFQYYKIEELEGLTGTNEIENKPNQNSKKTFKINRHRK